MSKWGDLLFIFLPIWVLWLVFFYFSSTIQVIELPTWAWVVFILGFDVSHVWSTIFRTYLDKDEVKSHKKLFIIAPLLAFALSVLLLSVSVTVFWRVMAYIAVFHFIKQQYGFAILYKSKSGEKRKSIISEKLVIYIVTLYPIVFWHFNSTSNINWFVENDFFKMYKFYDNTELIQTIFYALNYAYWIFIATWLTFEIKDYLKGKIVSVAKVLWILTTAVNWWFGIVYYNSDLIFSLSNVVAHGLPYLVLIYFYSIRKEEIKLKIDLGVTRRLKKLMVILTTILCIALFEEYLWDMLVYRDNPSFFENIFPYNWNQISDHWGIVLVISILALPQQVHYIIDGFIWKFNDKNKYLKPIFKSDNES